jgi:hypothetical protein
VQTASRLMGKTRKDQKKKDQVKLPKALPRKEGRGGQKNFLKSLEEEET